MNRRNIGPTQKGDIEVFVLHGADLAVIDLVGLHMIFSLMLLVFLQILWKRERERERKRFINCL